MPRARRKRRDEATIDPVPVELIHDEIQAITAENNDLTAENIDLRFRLSTAEGKLRTVQILLESPGSSYQNITVEGAARELKRRRILPPSIE